MKLPDLFSLKGKVAIVTGGGRGMGRFIAIGLAEAGADVVIASRKIHNLESTAEEIRKGCGTHVLPVACDIAEAEDVERLVDSTLLRFSRIDILVNSAGVTWGAPTLEFPIERWDHVFCVNVRGVWILTQSVARVMRTHGGGSIINVSSVMGSRGSEETMHPAIPYNSTKAAINVLTMNLAVKLAEYGIRVNAIAPGFFRTDMMAYLARPEFQRQRETILEAIPMRREGDIDDVRGVAVFLASAASAYITGQIVAVDGGYLAH